MLGVCWKPLENQTYRYIQAPKNHFRDPQSMRRIYMVSLPHWPCISCRIIIQSTGARSESISLRRNLWSGWYRPPPPSQSTSSDGQESNPGHARRPSCPTEGDAVGRSHWSSDERGSPFCDVPRSGRPYPGVEYYGRRSWRWVYRCPHEQVAWRRVEDWKHDAVGGVQHLRPFPVSPCLSATEGIGLTASYDLTTSSAILKRPNPFSQIPSSRLKRP